VPSFRRRVAVIGCGLFGGVVALGLALPNEVVVFERQSDLLTGASFNNARRVHLGHHYPRDFDTAAQCVRGFERFVEMFPDCVLGGFPNAYFVAEESTRTSPGDYLRFASRLGAPCRILDVAAFSPAIRGVSVGIEVPEAVYDAALLRGELRGRLDQAGVRLVLDCGVDRIERHAGGGFLVDGEPFDAVVNCAYEDGNRLDAQLGHARPTMQYERTITPIAKWDHPPVGITMMDGPFFTILPHGKTGAFLLYHVVHSVLESAITAEAPAAWRQPIPQADREAAFARIRDAATEFVPALASVRLEGFLEGPRVVLPHMDMTDARPSIVRSPEPGYVSVLSGKVDHCVEAADAVVSLLSR